MQKSHICPYAPPSGALTLTLQGALPIDLNEDVIEDPQTTVLISTSSSTI